MKNRFFQEMRRIGIRYRRGVFGYQEKDFADISIYPPFTEGQSFAFKFWAIAERYHASEIIVDDLPTHEEIIEMLKTFVRAGITTLVVEKPMVLQELIAHGCSVVGEVKVYRRETELYQGDLEIIKGTKIEIHE